MGDKRFEAAAFEWSAGRRGFAAIALFALAVVSWRGHMDRGTTVSRPRQEERTSRNQAKTPPVDLHEVMRQVHFAYRTVDGPGDYGAAHDTYAVRADARGVTLRARTTGADGTSVESAPLRLEHATIARGARSVSVAGASTSVASDGHLVLSQGPVAEHYRNNEHGMEQSWSFERLPAGEGELRVRVPVHGMEYAGETPTGLHLADARSGLGFRYGHGTWIDAHDRRTAVPARFSAGAIELSVPAEVIAASAYPARLDPLVSPEVAVDEPVEVAKNTLAGDPRAAWNGTHYLVVWTGWCRGTHHGVCAARIDATGKVLDTPVTVLLEGPADSLLSVASNGTDFLVAWERSGDIYTARVAADATVLDPQGITVSAAPHRQSFPSVASDGSQYLVTWEDERSGAGQSDIYAARVAATGEVLDTQGVLITAKTAVESRPSVASTGGEFLIVWSDAVGDGTVRGARVSGAGAVLSATSTKITPGGQVGPSIAANDGGYLVVWRDFRDGNDDVRGARIDPSGAVLDADSIVISPAEPGDLRQLLQVAADDAGFLVVWDAGGGTSGQGARVRNDGVVTDAEPSAIAGGWPCVAGASDGFLVAWELSGTIAATRVDGNGAQLDTNPPIAVVRTVNDEGTPSVAAGDGQFLVTWVGARLGGNAIYGVRIAADGTVKDPSGIEIAKATIAASLPEVAWNGSHFLVAWYDVTGTVAYATVDQLRARRVAGDGSLPDAAPLQVGDGGTISGHRSAGVASNGTDFLLVWEDSCCAIRGARVSAAGALLDPTGFELSQRVSNKYAPRVAWGSDTYLVVWGDNASAVNGVYATRVTDEGSVLDADGIPIVSGGTYADVAWSGAEFFVASNVSVPDGSSWRYDVVGARVASDGTLLDPSSIDIATDVASGYVSVASDSQDVLVTWGNEGTRVRAGGVVEVPDGVRLVSTPIASQRIASVAPSQYLLVYVGLSSETPGGTQRVSARHLQFGADAGAVCGGDAECDSGFCTGGTCAARTQCSAKQFEATAPTSLTDRVCAELTVCAADEYQATAPTATSDRACTALTTCSASTYESKPATSTSDRVCSAITICATGEYELYAPGPSSDRQCAPVTECNDAQYEIAAPTATSNRGCDWLQVCTAVQYEKIPPTATTNRQCEQCSVCKAGTRLRQPCTAISNAVCDAVLDAGSADDADDAGVDDDGGEADGSGVDRLVDAGDTGITLASDGGDAGDPGDAGSASSPGDGCGCSVIGAGDARGLHAIIALLLAATTWRRRVSRRR